MRKAFLSRLPKCSFISFFFLCATVQMVGAQEIMDIQTSAEANGMAGIASSLPSDEAAATIANPAQLGIFSLEGILNASTYAAKASWLGSNNLNVTALNVGIKSSDFFDFPFQFSVGAGYSRTFLGLGSIIWMSGNGNIRGLLPEWEKQENYTIGVGVDWFVKLGFGYNFKTLNADVPISDSSGYRSSVANTNAHDYGAMVQIPAADIVSYFADQPLTISPKLKPVLNINIGYARRNIGDYLFIPGAILESSYQSLPRTATLGLNFDLGIKTVVENREWTFFSFIWAREAEDQLLLNLPLASPAGNSSFEFQYKSGLGNIEPIDNLILGRTYGKVDLRKGWQVQLADFLFVRGGKFEGIGYSYSTFGTSVKLNGLLKLLAAFDMVNINSGTFAFLVDHLDLQYDYSRYSTGAPLNGTTFKAINLVIK